MVKEKDIDIIGKIINDKYHVTKKIGEGGMSKVYLANDISRKRDVAVKVLKKGSFSKNIEDIIRFKNEANIISQFDHDNIIKIYEVGDCYDTHFIATEYIDGISLYELLKRENYLSNRQIYKIIIQLASTLHYIHINKIIHRDIKPANILLKNIKNNISIKLIDFGLSQIKEFSSIDDPDLIKGTFSYMSPEQCGVIRREVDERSDLYSLGIIFYQLLCRTLPFEGDSVNTIIYQHIAKKVQFKDKFTKDIPEIYKKIVLKLLEKDQENRYQSAAGLIKDLKKSDMGRNNFVPGLNDKKIKINYRTNLIGRDKELEEIKKIFLRSDKDKKGCLCIINGEAGCGKTRLAHEVSTFIYSSNSVYLENKCFSGNSIVPFQVVKDLINIYINHFNKYSPLKKEDIRKKINENFRELGQILIDFNPLLKDIIKECKPLVKLEPEKENQRFLMVISSFIQELSIIEDGLTIFIDDIQWLDESSIEILKSVIFNIDSFPLFILSACREEEKGSIFKDEKLFGTFEIDNNKVFMVNLDRFGHDQMNRFISNILYEKEDRVLDVSNLIYAKSNGNIYFAIEVLRQFIDEKIIFNENNLWEIDLELLNKANLNDLTINLALKYIDSLNKKEIELFEYASAVRKTFDIDLLSILLKDFEINEIVEIIDKGIERHILEENFIDKKKISFINEQIRENFYKKLDKSERKKIHYNIAKTLELHKEKDNKEVIYELAYHYNEAGDTDKTLEYAYPSALNAKKNFANEDAMKYFDIVKDILEKKNKRYSNEWMQVQQYLGEINLLISKNDKAIQIFTDLLDHKDNMFERAFFYEQISYAYFRKGDFINCERYGEAGLKLLGERLYNHPVILFFSIIKEFILMNLIRLFIKKYRLKKDTYKKEKNKKIVAIYFSLANSYAFSNILKFILITLKMLNISVLKIGISIELAKSLFGLGIFNILIAKFRASKNFFSEALQMYRSLNDKIGVSIVNQLIAYSETFKANYFESIDKFKKNIQEYNSLGDIQNYIKSSSGMAHCYFYIGDFSNYIKIINNNLNLSQQINYNYLLLESQIFSDLYYIDTGDLERININFLNQIIYESDKNNFTLLKFLSCINLCKYYLSKDNYEEILRILKIIKKIENYVFPPYYIEYYIYNIEALLLEYDIKKELSLLKEIKSACKKALIKTKPWPTFYGCALRVTAKYYALINKNKRAKKYFIQSMQFLDKIGRKNELAKSLYEYAMFLKKIKDETTAKTKLESAYNIFSNIGELYYKEKIAKLLNIEKSPSIIERFLDKQRLTTIIKMSQQITSILNLDDLLSYIMKNALEVTGAQRGFLFLYDESNNKLNLKATEGVDSTKQHEYSSDILNKVLKEKHNIIIDNAMDDKKYNIYDSVISYRLKSIIAHPILHGDKLIGICYLDNQLSASVFTSETSELLSVFMSQAGIAIENTYFYENLEQKVKERTKELIKAKEFAEQMSLNKSDFLAKVSHEIRTPMNAIMGFAEIINKTRSLKKNKYYSTQIIKETERLLELINMLLDMSKAEAGKLEIVNNPFDITELINSLHNIFKDKVEQKNLYFLKKIPKKLFPYLIGDSLRIYQVLMNLIGNAIKFTNNGGIIITVKVIEDSKEKQKLYFSVKDTGIGIPENRQSRIFKDYSQADSSISHKYGGTGLGTSISKQLINLMGGDIKLDSKEGVGSNFYFVIELLKYYGDIKKTVYNKKIESENKQILKNAEILVVDDNKINQEIAVHSLENISCLVDIADNGFMALKQVKNKRYDLILMDVEMPGMDGYEATKKIRLLDHAKDIPIIGMTAHAFDKYKNECLDAGMSDVIFKPVRKNVLLNKVAEWIFRGAEMRKTAIKKEIKRNKTDKNNDPINYNFLLREFDDDKELLHSLIKELIDKINDKLPQITEYIDKKDAKMLDFEAHSLKGAALNLECKPLAKITKELENHGKKGEFSGCNRLVNKLKKEVGRLEEFALKSHIIH